MENRFDDLTKALAEGIPRRQALRRLATLFGGALLGTFAFGSVARPASKTCCVYANPFNPSGPPIVECVEGPCPPGGLLGSSKVGDCKKCDGLISP